jgi:outer membrane receptor protein involved in Fe transport
MKTRIPVVYRLVIALFTLFIIVLPAWAQVGTGTISGTVTDASGAVVPNAAVTIKNTQTGVATKAMTNSEGLFVAPGLPASTYDVETQAQGFKTQVQRVTLTVGAQLVTDFNLTAGAVSETVNVTADAAQLQTASSEISALISQRQLRELPLNGRNYEQLILLAPGVQRSTTSAQGSFYGRQPSYSVSGSRPVGQAVWLDGADINGFWEHASGNAVVGTSLGVEAIGEFQVSTNTYTARFGGSGSVVNAATKSGTNQWHGSAYEFHRNSALDARNFFDVTKPSFRRNQYGGTIGGPIRQNKSFFFVNYEGLRQGLGLTAIASVPDDNARNGLVPCASAPAVACVNGLANVGVNAKTKPILDLFPRANNINLGGGVARYISIQKQIAKEDFVTTRFDHSFSPTHSGFVRYIFDHGTLLDPVVGGQTGLFPELSRGRNQYFTIEDKKTISSSLINLARFSFVRTYRGAFANANYPVLDFFPGEGRQNGGVGVGPLGRFGPSQFTPNFSVQNGFSFADDIVWVKGKHSLEIGMEYRRLQANHVDNFFTSGTYTFNTLVSFLQAAPASFLGALPNRANAYRGFRESRYYPYIQDTWKAARNLTLNLGLRYDRQSNPTEANGILFAFVNPAADADFTKVPNVFKTNPSTKNFAPRIGVSWDPFKDHKTVVRAGFGIFYSLLGVRNYMPAFLFAGPYQAALQIAPSFPIPFQGNSNPLITIGNSMTYDPQRTPYVAQYNLNIQRQLPGDFILTVSYVGSQGRNLLVPVDNNPIVPRTVNGVQVFQSATSPNVGASAPRQNPNTRIGALTYSRPNAPSWYNSMQLYVTRNLAQGLQFQSSYTYSKCLDQGSVSYGLEGNAANSAQLNPYDQTTEKGLCGFDVRHNYTGNLVYLLPFKQNELVRGWQASLIATRRTGQPFTVLTGFDRASIGGVATSRPNLVAGRSTNPILGKVEQWYDPTAFSLQAPGTLGNLARNTLRGPGLFTVDTSLAKTFKVTEKFSAQFRAEAFNLFNRANFAMPVLTLFTGPSCAAGQTGNCEGAGIRNPNAGRITSTVTTSRQFQFALKLMF